MKNLLAVLLVLPVLNYSAHYIPLDTVVTKTGPRTSELLEHIAQHRLEQELCFAAYYGWLDKVKEALKHGAAINYQNPVSGETPLATASKCGHIDVVTYLLEKGAYINLADDSGFTPLDLASFVQKTEVIDFLEANGGGRRRSR